MAAVTEAGWLDIARHATAGRQPRFELHALLQVCQLHDRQGGVNEGMNRSFGLAMIITVLTVLVGTYRRLGCPQCDGQRGRQYRYWNDQCWRDRRPYGKFSSELAMDSSRGCGGVFVAGRGPPVGCDGTCLSNTPPMAMACKKRDGTSATIAIARDYRIFRYSVRQVPIREVDAAQSNYHRGPLWQVFRWRVPKKPSYRSERRRDGYRKIPLINDAQSGTVTGRYVRIIDATLLAGR